jgi:hypothetical protein
LKRQSYGAAFFFQEKVINIEMERGSFLVRTEDRTFMALGSCAARDEGGQNLGDGKQAEGQGASACSDYLVFDAPAENGSAISCRWNRRRRGWDHTDPYVDGNVLAAPPEGSFKELRILPRIRTD